MNRAVNGRMAIVAVALGVAAAGLAACTVDAKAVTDQAHAAQVDRGRYLVSVGGCNDCHTPLEMGANGPEPDMSRILSGHPETFRLQHDLPAKPWIAHIALPGTAFSGRWGVSFAANLTPDPNTGTGIWTEDIFIKTIRTGRHWGVARPILPPMPWFNDKEMTDEDLEAVCAYLRSIAPIHKQVPAPIAPMTTENTTAAPLESAPKDAQ